MLRMRGRTMCVPTSKADIPHPPRTAPPPGTHVHTYAQFSRIPVYKKLQQVFLLQFLYTNYLFPITYFFLPVPSYLKIPSMESRLVELPVELMLLQRITSWMPFRATRPEMLESA